MESIKLSKKDALVLIKSTDEVGRQHLNGLFGGTLIKLKAIERIKTFADVLADQGINDNDWNDSVIGVDLDVVFYKKVKLVAKALNEGWTPNWADSNEGKYYPYFDVIKDKSTKSGFGLSYGGCDISCSVTSVGSRLVYRTRELAEYAGKQFLEIYAGFLL